MLLCVLAAQLGHKQRGQCAHGTRPDKRDDRTANEELSSERGEVTSVMTSSQRGGVTGCDEHHRKGQ
jgi:hypothetical protein